MNPHYPHTGRAEDSLYPDNREEHSNPESHQEQTALLGSEQEESLLSEEEDEEHALEICSRKNLPWWKRPSPYWSMPVFPVFVVITYTDFLSGSSLPAPFVPVANSAAVAPTVTLYTDVVCRVHRPEYVVDDRRFLAFPLPNTLAQTSTIVLIPQIYDDVETTGGDDFVHLPNDAYWSARSATLDYTQIDEKILVHERRDTELPDNRLVGIGKIHSSTVLVDFSAEGVMQLSDRYGRRIVIFASALGYFIINVVWTIASVLRRSTTIAMKQSYLTDTIDPSTRTRYFSLSLGFTYIGEAAGPFLGGLLIRSTGSILSVFYFVAISYGLYAIAILLILPESLTRARIRGARLRRRKVLANKAPSGYTPMS
ncbi:hypothetical protein JVU11DRAFT_3621 [Chiua virens]|nr:hypothetical protein JVU11DRAFT_3621 [Chiua virens]